MKLIPEHCACSQCEALRVELQMLRTQKKEHEYQAMERFTKELEHSAELSVRIEELEYALGMFHHSYQAQGDHECQALESADHWAELTLAQELTA